MTVAEKLTVIAQNEQKVYDAGFAKGASADYEDGQNAAMSEFWDYLTNYGNRTSYSSLFNVWGGETFEPTRKIIPIEKNSAYCTFNGAKNLKKIEADYIDFSQKVRGTKSQEGYYYTFYGCSSLEEIEDIGMQADFGYYSTFSSGSDGKLHTIAKIRTDENTVFNNAFNYCTALKNVTFEGVIGQDINIRWSPLTADSIRSIIEHLSDTASGKTLTLSKNAVESADFSSDDKVYISTDGEVGGYLDSNPILLSKGQTIKVMAEWKEGHTVEDYTDWWFGFSGDSATFPNFSLPWTYTAKSDEQLVIMWYFSSDQAVTDIPIKIRVVLIDENGNEVTGENLHSFMRNTLTNDNGKTLTIADESWRALRASKLNWTISLA